MNDYGKHCNVLKLLYSSQDITDRNLKLARIVEKVSNCSKNKLILSISELNFHFREGGGGGEIEIFVKSESE